MKPSLWIGALILLLFLAFCSTGGTVPDGSGLVKTNAGSGQPASGIRQSAGPGPDYGQAGPEDNAADPESGQPDGSESGTETKTDAGTDPGTEPGTVTEKTHVMDQNYIFRPIAPDGETKVVLLTFDDGPKDEDMVGRLLETLDKHGAKAIFFLNGTRIEAKPELAVRIYENGHAIGNHAWDHIVLPGESEETINRQIMDVQNLVKELIGEAPRFFRPPHGAGNDYIRAKVKEEGMLYMTWSNGSKDWMEGYQTPESVVEQVLDQLHPGSNILMHELPWTVEALDTLLTRLKELGYAFLDPGAILIEDAESGTALQTSR